MAGQTLGRSDAAIFFRVLLPLLVPALLAGISLSFARCLGEFGAIIFIAGNRPYQTEITALLAFTDCLPCAAWVDFPKPAPVSTMSWTVDFKHPLPPVGGWHLIWSSSEAAGEGASQGEPLRRMPG